MGFMHHVEIDKKKPVGLFSLVGMFSMQRDIRTQRDGPSFICLYTYWITWAIIIFLETIFQIFLCLFDNRKIGQRKTLSSQRKIWFGFQESVFLENLGGKHFPEVVKNLEMSYYLLIISNLVLQLLIDIYILFWIFIF